MSLLNRCRPVFQDLSFLSALSRLNHLHLDHMPLYWREMEDVLTHVGIRWFGWHGFRRGLASNLNCLGVDDSVIQAILRHSTVAVTQACYIKTAKQEAVAAMRQLSAAVKANCSPLCSPDVEQKKPITCTRTAKLFLSSN